MAPAPLLVTMGEPAGIGPELAAVAWIGHRNGADKGGALPPFAYVGCARTLEARARACGLSLPVRSCAPEDAADVFAEAIPVIDIPLVNASQPGKPDTANAGAVIEAIETAVGIVHQGRAAGLVTSPIHKATLYGAGFAHPGHTEFLGELAERLWGGEHKAVMMLACDVLRVVPVTVHIALSRVPQALSAGLIVETGRIVARDLAERFAIPAPRLALCGLNPHAGEDGAMGDEEFRVIAPAVETLRGEGIDAFGPLPADTLFHERARGRYDAVLAMYHDQALIPIKTIAFDRAVNVTLGLPFVRTSPDHGTAFDIAGTGRANPASLTAAIRLAGGMAGVGMAR